MSSAPSPADLERTKSGAKHVQTKAGAGLDPLAIIAMEKVYRDCGGDLVKIAKALGVKFKKGADPKTANAFAIGMVSGLLTVD